jgi:hypothetical protein
MEGRYPGAIRLIRTNCTDAAEEAAFNEWYDRVHVPSVLSSGMVACVVRYRNADPQDAGPGYLAIHELAWDDLDAVAREAVGVRQRLTRSGSFHPALEIVKAESWQRIGPGLRTPPAGERPVAGIFLIESRCTDPRRETEFNAWYDETHIGDLLDTRLFMSAYRFALAAQGTMIGAAVPAVPNEGDLTAGTSGDAGGATYLAIYETATESLAAVEEFSRVHRPRLKASGRLSDLIEVTWRGIYRQMISTT